MDALDSQYYEEHHELGRCCFVRFQREVSIQSYTPLQFENTLNYFCIPYENRDFNYSFKNLFLIVGFSPLYSRHLSISLFL